ncbi:uncharacterized protein LOC133381984, partial [Rhineura floridana]|uniref:uncharacterized protein LOC133381984 n=1 Tax=Rhineura floridana TaxID=261503 RepID=UPI002AC85537
FLHGELKKEIYMEQPPGCETQPGLVCKLQKSLYGLRQSARCWNEKLDDVLQSMNFKRCVADPCVYVKETKGGLTYCLVYVDDILYFSHGEEDEREFHNSLKQHVVTKSLGPVSHYLGTEVIRGSDGSFVLKQEGKIKQILAECGMSECKAVGTPMTTSFQQETTETACENPARYRHIIGQLQYLVKVTRPDICNAVSILSRKVEQPTETDWQGIKRVLRYLQGTSSKGLVLSSSKHGSMCCYVDADHAGDPSSRKSTTGVVILLYDSVIDWCSKRQTIVATSSSEAEYIALSLVCNELTWFDHLLFEIGNK